MEEYNCKVCFDDKTHIGCYACTDDESEDELLYATDYTSIPIENNNCTYFGRLSDEQPDVGVIYSMLDVHIEKIITKRADDFSKLMKDQLIKFKKSIKEELTKNKKSLLFMKTEIKFLQKNSVEFEKHIKELKKENIKLMHVRKDINEDQEMADVKAALVKKGVIKEAKIEKTFTEKVV